jgi:hypothetical protein
MRCKERYASLTQHLPSSPDELHGAFSHHPTAAQHLRITRRRAEISFAEQVECYGRAPNAARTASCRSCAARGRLQLSLHCYAGAYALLIYFSPTSFVHGVKVAPERILARADTQQTGDRQEEPQA